MIGAPPATPHPGLDRLGVQDADLMARALAVAERGRTTSAPNPWVGCVIVRDGIVLGEGYHRVAGEPHAEVHALRAAGEKAQGATAYVTLEPCAHYGRTPPCVDGLVRSGVERVVVAVLDPDRRVAGRGVERLRAAGLRVETGVGATAVARSLAPYLHHRRTGFAFCVLKAAMSLDGRIAAADGSSQWITQPAARSDAHQLRAESQAVIIGADTALKDVPTLTARATQAPVQRQPLRVLLDARGRVPACGPLFDPQLAATLVFTTRYAHRRAVADWRAAGAEVAEVRPAAGNSGVDLPSVLAILGERGVLQALVEGGATVLGAFVRADLARRLVLYVGTRILGEQGRPLFAGVGPTSLSDASRWRLMDARHMGEDLRLEYEPLGDAHC